MATVSTIMIIDKHLARAALVALGLLELPVALADGRLGLLHVVVDAVEHCALYAKLSISIL